MYESRQDPGDLYPVASAISEAMRDWLAAEIVSSSTSRNSYLDNFQALQETIKLPFNDLANTNSAKAKAHYDRMRSFLPVFEESPQNDAVAAKTLFFIQMHLSGLFRKQCYLQATTQVDYEQRRFSGDGLGIDIAKIVEDEVTAQQETIRVEDIVELTSSANQIFYETNKRLHESGAPDIGKEESPSVDMLKRQQEILLRVAVDHILFAAKIRGGDLAAVPFWEAKSISDIPEIYYPFAA